MGKGAVSNRDQADQAGSNFMPKKWWQILFFSVGKYVISTARLTCPVQIPACRNPRFPDAIRKLTPITQLYISQSLGAVHPSKRLSVQEGHR